MWGRYLISAAMALVAASSGCSETDDSISAAVGTELSNIADEAVVVGSETNQLDVELDEDQKEPLEIAWDDDSVGETVSELSFTITNNKETDLTFDLEFLSDGALGASTTSLGKHTLPGNQNITLDIDAEAIPVRSSVAVSVARARLTRHIETWKGPRDVHAYSSPLYYRHTTGFGAVSTYSREFFEEELNGELYSGSASLDETSMEQTLGEKTDDGGEFSVVSVADSPMVLRDESNEIVGVISRVEIGVADTTEIAAMAVHASAVAAEETEASDE